MNIGDTVVIISPKPKYRMPGRNNIYWTHLMDESIGKTVTIIDKYEDKYVIGKWYFIDEWFKDPFIVLVEELEK